MQESGRERYMNPEPNNEPAIVTGPCQSRPAGEAHDRWWWVEPGVWTQRMLTRLEQSEPTTVWYGLWDKLISERNLQAAFWAVWRNRGAPGVDGQTGKQFETQEAAQLAQLREELRTKRYCRQRPGGSGYPSQARPRSDRWAYRR